jgi:acyl transferase domain-containing protein
MDPQQRLLLEVGWEALEDAGIRPGGLAGSNTGVFIGISNNDFFLRFSQSSNWDRHIATGGAPSIAANRISYFLDLRGPSIAIDTACSSSLVAVHQACQSLKTGEINLAMAGGVNLILDDCWNQVLANAQMLSPTGRCHSFQSTADGYVRGEGGGMVILKRVSDAVKDGDRIIAVIKGHAVNQDGRSNGLTAPNGLAQQDVIRRALSMANIRADRVGYVEAHGTGTRIGDPIEFHALRTIVGRETPDRKTCYVGSVKSNIGHLEAAAGIAGLIKVILSLHHQYIPPSLLRADINEQLQPADFLKIADSGRVWESRDRRVAAVSSFGFGGTNAHVVVEEEAPAISPATPVALPQTSFPLAVCAHSSAALGVVARSYESWIREALQVDPTVRLGDLCAAVNGVRSQLPCRRVLNVRTSTDALRQLEELANDADRMAIPLHYAPVQALFVFGNTNPSDSAFAERLVALCDRFREAEFRARALVEAAYDPNGGDESRRHITFQVALCRLLVDLGVVPSGYVAKGSGELAARIAATMIPLTRQPLDSESLRGDSLMIAMGSDNPLAPSNEPVGDAWNWLLNQLATAYQSGFDIAWERLYGSDARRRTPPLPAYPWQREKYWPAGDRANNVNCTSSATDFRGAGGGPAIGDGAQRELSMEVDGGDRGVTNEDYLNTVFQMAETVFGSPSLELREFVVFCRPHAAAALRVTMTRSAHDSVHFRVLDNTLKGGSLGLKCCAEGAVYSLDKPTVPRGAV